ncbi:dentin sialophosphoprotein-like [Asterias rubens]|uniref:dentin sialophosphoprotein-like n=1 Tax=Asterias rubens TaxID=7604 RepID=UPI0014557477|nr:dentin sialophosphoprotein-like [Asterias rubens]
MADDAEEIDLSLDSLLNKYGASRRSAQHAAESEPSRGDNEAVDRVEQPSQFLQEIRERAEILSRNAAKARKVALQNVVNDDSKLLRSASANSSLDMFVDVIRSANIAGEDTTSSLSVSSGDEDLISSDDLLQPILPLDAAPWRSQSPRDSEKPWDIEGSLDTGGPWMTREHEGSKVIESPLDVEISAEVPWKCESAWRTGKDVEQSKTNEKANRSQGMEGAWNTENNDSLGDYGLSTEPWGTPTSHTNDDITESEDSDTTSEESSDSQDGVDGSHGNISTNDNSTSLTLNWEQDQLASYERSDNVSKHRDDDSRLVWSLQTNSHLTSQPETADVKSEDLWSKTALVDEEVKENSDEVDIEEDELKDDDSIKDVSKGRAEDGTSTRGYAVTVSSLVPSHTCDSNLDASSPNHNNERFSRQIDDKMSLDDGVKIGNEFDGRSVNLTGSEVETTTEMQTVQHEDDGRNDDDQPLCLIGKNVWKNILEDEGQGDGEAMDQQLTSDIMVATLVGNSLFCGSNDAVEVQRDKDDNVEVFSMDITAVAETDDSINPVGIGSQIGAITREMDGGTEQFLTNLELSFDTDQSDHSNLKLSFDTNQSDPSNLKLSFDNQSDPSNRKLSFDTSQLDATSNVTDNLSSGAKDHNVCVESNVKDDLKEVASSLHVEHSTCLELLLPTMDISLSAKDDKISARNKDEMETTNAVSQSRQPKHPSSSDHGLLLPTVTNTTSTVMDANDDTIQDEIDLSSRSHPLYSQIPNASMEADKPLDSSSSVFKNNDSNVLDVSLEEDLKTGVKVDTATSGSHTERLRTLDQVDSESNVGDGLEGRVNETRDASKSSSSSSCIQHQSFRDERTESFEVLPHGNIPCTQSLSLESMNDKSNPIAEKSETKFGLTASKTVSYNTNNSNMGNLAHEKRQDVHKMLQKSCAPLSSEEDVSRPNRSNLRQSIKSVNLRTPNLEKTPNKDLTQDDLHNQTEGVVFTKDMHSSRGTTLDSPKEIPKSSEKEAICSHRNPPDEDAVRTVKGDYKTKEQESKKVCKGRHPEGLERSQQPDYKTEKQDRNVWEGSHLEGMEKSQNPNNKTKKQEAKKTKDGRHHEGLDRIQTLNYKTEKLAAKNARDGSLGRGEKLDYNTEKQEAKKGSEGRHPEVLERTQNVHQSKSVGVRAKSGVNPSRGASSTNSGRQATLTKQDTKDRKNSSEQSGVNPEGDDDGVRAVSVRNLIARFNGGKVLAPEPPSSETRRGGRGVSGLGGRATGRLTSMEVAHEDRPLMRKESSETAMETVNQVIPWMQELANRRKRTGHGSVWEKMTKQMSEK